jgi:sugar O-acyltransferase (sialic acid O-acetyltransferase NeuD family)
MRQSQAIVILGTGGNCIDILETVEATSQSSTDLSYHCVGFLDDDEVRWGTEIRGVEVLGPLRKARSLTGCVFINGIGSPSSFRHKSSIIESTGLSADRFASVFHPTASISRSASFAPGCAILQGVVINNNVKVGAHVIVLPMAVLSHDTRIGDYSCIASAAVLSGNVTIEESCYVGANATLRQGIHVGGGALIGAGAVVVRDVESGASVVGNPARPLIRD